MSPATHVRSPSPTPAADPAEGSRKKHAHTREGESSSSSSTSSPRSAPSSSVPGAAPVPPQAPEATISNLSSIITRIMMASRFIFSGGVDVVGTLNDMALMEKCMKKLAKQVERFTTAIKGVAHALVEATQTMPAIAEAAVRAGSTFFQVFPFLSRFGS